MPQSIKISAALTRAASEAGVSAHVGGGLSRGRNCPVLDAAIAQFHQFAPMRKGSGSDCSNSRHGRRWRGQDASLASLSWRR